LTRRCGAFPLAKTSSKPSQVPVKIIESPYEAYAHLDQWRRDSQRIGLVPTMGALHQGHLSLVQRSVEECDVTAVWIFVNPTQFGPHDDYSRYPRTFEQDCELLRPLGVELVFAPTRQQIYPDGFSTYVQPPRIAEPLEGKFRPGHFQGVATVVLKLFQILPADIAYFGQKDFQQLAMIRHMAEDLNLPVRIESCETVREADGLALSSRNRYLSDEQRQVALSLWRALQTAAKSLAEQPDKPIGEVEAEMHRVLVDGGVDRIDYARIVCRETLVDLSSMDRPAVALIAAHVGKTRLIDNLLIDAVN
jgi:pantoate--beta-alanine ligase